MDLALLPIAVLLALSAWGYAGRLLKSCGDEIRDYRDERERRRR